MTDRVFTVHVETPNGSYTSFDVDAPSYSEAYAVAKEQLDPGEILSGVTEKS